MRFIFIDGSYFIFFRFHALRNWWKLAHQDEEDIIPNENEEFKTKFRKIFVDKLKEIPRKIGIKKGEPYRIFVGKDCKQQKIWRMVHHPTYKGNRPDTTTEGHFFKMVYDEHLFEKTLGENCILSYPSLEADDVIALSVKHICSKNNLNNSDNENMDGGDKHQCFIISSDGDYLQLCNPHIHIFDLKYKDLKTRNPAYSIPEQVEKMFIVKRLCGDKSDNIQSVFPKCGKKTAEKLAEMSYADLMNELSKRGDAVIKQYKLNDLLMNFDNIPEHLTCGFIQSVKLL